MTEQKVERIERTFNIELPLAYRQALSSHNLSGGDENHPEFLTDDARLIEENGYFLTDPNKLDDLANIKKPGILGAIKFFLSYGFRDRVIERRQKCYEEWVGNQRFIIGNDMSEEYYYIVLSEKEPAVYCYELETGKSRKAAASIQEWLISIRKAMLEVELEDSDDTK